MTMTTISPIKQALVSTIRANSTLMSQVSGIYEGFAPSKVAYPFVVYNMAYAPYDFAWDSVMIVSGFDITIWAENSVVANTLDALVVSTLHDTELSVTGQSTLLCRRVGEISFSDMDDEGKKVYQIGGTYEVWTNQPN